MDGENDYSDEFDIDEDDLQDSELIDDFFIFEENFADADEEFEEDCDGETDEGPESPDS